MNDRELREYVDSVVEHLGRKGMVAETTIQQREGRGEYNILCVTDPNYMNKTVVRTHVWVDTEVSDPSEMAEEIYTRVSQQQYADKNMLEVAVAGGYEGFKMFLQPRFVNSKIYKAFLETVPHRNFLDCAITYTVKVDDLCATITNDYMEKLGLTEEQLYEDAVKNIKLEPLHNIVDTLCSQLDIPSIKMAVDLVPMYVMSDKDVYNGAIRILYPGYLKSIGEQLGDYYLYIPANAFAIVMPVTEMEKEMSRDTIKKFNRQVSQKYTGIEYYLTDETYVYRMDRNILEKVKEERKPTRGVIRRAR